MKISKLEYVKMQVMIYTGLVARLDSTGHAEAAKKRADDTIKLNGITVTDEAENPGVKPLYEEELNDMFESLARMDVSFDECMRELKKRGLVIV